MISSTKTTALGTGIYTPAEAAFYARVKTQTMNRWMYGNKTGEPVVQPQLTSDERIVTFLDFVQALAIRDIRRMYGASLQKIRGAVEHAESKYGIRFPLARKHTTYLFKREDKKNARPEAAFGKSQEKGDDNRYEIMICLDADKMVQLTGKQRDNYVIREIVELFLDDLSFGDDGLAERYCPWKRGDLVITMDPKRRFGEPLLPSGYTAETLWEAVTAEGGIDGAARAYGIDRAEVELAWSYLDFLQGPNAA